MKVGSQLVKDCKNMIISFSNIQHKLSVDFETCPVGAQQIKKSMWKELENRILFVIQWEMLRIQIANSINNMPINIGNQMMNIENLDILTPNRLILGCNNDRCPTVPLELNNDHKWIIFEGCFYSLAHKSCANLN